ncbi:holin family protein [Microbaculum marinisediminis]|uniref:Holin family protein n=1 Tax=Microbaculum marinisediminis TaxID=2931392 RepID=A0AAW5QT40_9HYPH|nr:holin family protein [Microbaculum sp. A6E488]MCT8971201.1 holin family protein [Microbaculum sp. A6E488]
MIGALTPFLGPVLEIVRRVIPDPAERARIEAELTQAASDAEARLAEAQAAIITTEARGGPLQRNWRPLFMIVCMGLLVWHAVAVPILAAILHVPLDEVVGLKAVPDGLWTLLVVGMGGYIGGRSLEKVFTGRDR